jgi:hypothetical protein
MTGIRSLVSCVFAALPARGETFRCPAGIGAHSEVADIDAGVRLAWIAKHLSQERRQALRWSWGWGIGLAASGVGSLAAVPWVGADERVDWYASAASAAIGLAPLLLTPLDAIGDATTLDIGSAIQDPQHDKVCALLADAELRLARSAGSEADGRSWWMHAGNLAINAGVLLFLGLGYSHWEAGAINSAVGVAVGEAMIFTQPTGSVDALSNYRAGRLAIDGGASAGIARQTVGAFTLHF